MKRRSLRRVLSSVMAVIFLVSSVLVYDVVTGSQVTATAANDKDALGNEGRITTQNDVGDQGRGVIYANSRTDFRDETIYFVITTRFYDGDPSNNARTAEDDNKAHNPENDPSWRGDFKGLIDKLDYIKALGFTAVWITPVVQNDSGYDYHGYHAYDFSAVDYRYESNGVTYQDLIDACHAKGMKIIQDIVLNHTCNWGEKNLLQITDPVYKGGRSEVVASGKYDTENIYHHNGFCGGSDWDNYSAQDKTIHDDCFDLETENPKAYNYLVDCYKKYINMGVDGFRVDTVKHISRLTFNSVFMPAFKEAGGDNFYMFGEVCTKGHDVWYREQPGISTSFYTWADNASWTGRWSDDLASNEALVQEHYTAHSDMGNQPTSKNAFLDGNNYHTPDYSQKSYMDVIDFQMHWSFNSANSAFDMAKKQDAYFNDSTWNVVYVDSHDYAPDECQTVRYTGGTDAWAENLSLMFTFRGIPCVYYGSEIEFQKGKPIDVGPSTQLANTGRAYFGDHIEGSVDVVDFARYTNATGEMAKTLNSPLALHIQRLNRLRAAIPALRKGQYSTEGCSGSMAYKRRYTDSTTDSFALIAVTRDATFTGIPNGKYTDAITGDVKDVSNGTLSTSGIKGQGDLRVYVLDTDLTKAPGMIDGFSDFMSGGKEIVIDAVEPTGISLDKTSASLDLGETVKFTATVAPADATNKAVTWKSSDTTVATVSGSGQVTAKSEGTATIYAATSNAASFDDNSGLVAKATVTVKASGVRVTSLNLTKTSVTLNGGEAVTIKTTILPPNASPKYAAITWTSSDEAVAKVSSTGVITGVKKGKATITATTMDGVSAKVEVEVNGTVIYGNAIYFEKPSDWGNKINMYMWSDDPKWENAAWPGVEMSLIDEEKGIYGIEWPEGKNGLNVIFNDGGNKTDDLKNAKMNGYYNKDGFVREEPTK
ncbi:MAG: Ig-like domain-containing protein, partial [Lachnospiraceae bacterium]|nr:Ig-like domain-containing protein [Lachnospiraceae bacterium]